MRQQPISSCLTSRRRRHQRLQKFRSVPERKTHFFHQDKLSWPEPVLLLQKASLGALPRARKIRVGRQNVREVAIIHWHFGCVALCVEFGIFVALNSAVVSHAGSGAGPGVRSVGGRTPARHQQASPARAARQRVRRSAQVDREAPDAPRRRCAHEQPGAGGDPSPLQGIAAAVNLLIFLATL